MRLENPLSSPKVTPGRGANEAVRGNEAATSCRPVLRWAGSKQKLIPLLEEYWRPEFKTYVEPFAGSACLFFHLAPAKAILGDNNSDLVEMYEVIRRDPVRLARRLAHIPRTSDAYYRWRSIPAQSLDPERRALRFLYLNRHCFNGIFRTNREGAFNVPFGTRLPDRLTTDDLLACARLLKDAVLVSGDFERTVQRAKAGDFVYLDPPFAMSRKRNRSEYGHAAFSQSDIARLNDAMYCLNAIGAHFLVSYGDCPEARQLQRNWISRKVRVRRHVAGFAGDRRHAYEWMISNVAPRVGVQG